MSQRFRIISLTVLLVLGLVFGSVLPDYIHPAKDFSLDSKEFAYLKKEATKGSQKACKDVAVIFDYYEKYSEAVKYWECSINKKSVFKSIGMRHLAGYYINGLGVDVDPAKGAMYLILSPNVGWPKSKEKKLKPWLDGIPYADFSDIEAIETKFEEGAQLARDYIKNNNITDSRLTEDKLDENLRRHLYSLKNVDGTILIRHLIFFGFLIMLLLGVVESVFDKFFGRFKPHS